MVPLQVMLAKTPQLEASAASLAAVVPIAISGVLVYYFGARSGPEVDVRFAVFLMIGGVVGAYVGARLAPRIPAQWLGRFVAVVLGAVGVKQLLFP